jgi:hypothetical protein
VLHWTPPFERCWVPAHCGAMSGKEGKEGKVYSLISVANNKFSRTASQITFSVGRSYAAHIPHIPRGSGELIEHDFGVGILDDWIQPTPRCRSISSGREVSGSAHRNLGSGRHRSRRRRLDLDLNGIFDGHQSNRCCPDLSARGVI